LALALGWQQKEVEPNIGIHISHVNQAWGVQLGTETAVNQSLLKIEAQL
jgi:hypothetical protein